MLISVAEGQRQKASHSFFPGPSDFILDGAPYQIISGEMHPARIPAEYWRHRIQMAKAMGCNTITVSIFWNYHETEEGVFDFYGGNRYLAGFFEMVKEENMWLIVKPGPYVSDDWESGGIPAWLQRKNDIRFRSTDPQFMTAAERYMEKLAVVLAPFMITNGGPLILLQIENEYGSFGSDRKYLEQLKDIWVKNGINIPFFTSDIPSAERLKAGTLPGCAVGLVSGTTSGHFETAAGINPGVPVFSSEIYTGRPTNWGGKLTGSDTTEFYNEIKFLMDNRKSFNLCMIHGGTNFGFTAGASSGGEGYEPVLTSYDYDAPVDEQGNATPKYYALRRIINSYMPKVKKEILPPEPLPAMETSSIALNIFTSIWDNLPAPKVSVVPESFEAVNQDDGFVLYTTELTGDKQGELSVNGLHDYATVFLDGRYVGNLDRTRGRYTIDLPAIKGEKAILEIFTEAMGRLSFSPDMVDRKGITGSVTLDGKELLNWNIYSYPMSSKFMYDMRSSNRHPGKEGIFFRGNFFITTKGDIFLDMSNFKKGIIWVNGHNLGRYWEIGPQKRILCPATFLRDGSNEIMLFDLHKTSPAIIVGKQTPK